MPTRAKRICVHPGCAAVCAGPRCEKHQHDPSGRPGANENGYTYRWQRARLMFLRQNPLCITCWRKGLTEAATVVDHVIPHRRDQERFWDRTNWQALCARCHNAKSAKERVGVN